MGRVFFNTRKNIQTITANHTVLPSDSGSTFIVLPAGTTLLSLPTPSNAGDGWNITVILQSDSGFGGDGLMDNIVNIGLGDFDTVGLVLATDTAAGDQAVDGDDFIACTVDASPGDRFEILTDGTRWFVHGLVADTDVATFAASAAS